MSNKLRLGLVIVCFDLSFIYLIGHGGPTFSHGIYITAHWRHDGQDGGGHHCQPQRLDCRGADRPECVQV